MKTDPLLAGLSAGGRVSGAVLARRLGLSRAAVHKRIQTLRRRGYAIDGASRLGYRLDAAPDIFDPAAIRLAWVHPLHKESTASTQDDAKALALAGAPEGTLVVADRQSAGRGRLGRVWSSPAGGLWFSLVLRPKIRPEAAPALALVAALALARAVKRFGVEARLKWPNDVWVGEKKLAGLLTEMSAESDRVHWLVLGVGVNVANPPPAEARTPAVSLAGLLPKPPARAALLAGWLKEFHGAYGTYQRRGFTPFRAAFERLSVLKSRPVSFEADGGLRRGEVLGVDGEGRLRLRTPGGTVVFRGGEVSLLRLQRPIADGILKRP